MFLKNVPMSIQVSTKQTISLLAMIVVRILFSSSLAFVWTLANGAVGNIDFDGTSTDSTLGPSHELSVSDMDYYVNTEEGRTALKLEFHTIKGGQRRSWNEALKPENRKKNRYEDLFAYDCSRVRLVTASDEESDYINANYINGTDREREYIATQGPLPQTINDFWNMIWNQNATKIVMLANLVEHNESKVAKYWPDNSAEYGPFNVSQVSNFTLPRIKLVMRIFSVRKDGESRLVSHFHFTGWPDLGVPDDRLSVISIMHLVRKHRPNTEPIITHCSAGVGRTGTVILMDSMMQRAQQEGLVDFSKRLDYMRVQRVDLVEKQDQYVFAHQAVYERMSSEFVADFLSNLMDAFSQKMDEIEHIST